MDIFSYNLFNWILFGISIQKNKVIEVATQNEIKSDMKNCTQSTLLNRHKNQEPIEQIIVITSAEIFCKCKVGKCDKCVCSRNNLKCNSQCHTQQNSNCLNK